jgi:molybdenum cofactor biosynthesis protein B
MSSKEHRAMSPSHVTCSVITISDTRTLETDTGGRSVAQALEAQGHTVHQRLVVKDEAVEIRLAVEAALAEPAVDAVLTTGGTGISRRDVTYEVVAALMDKRLDGFGEIFRMLSYQEIGAAAMLSRACAGTASGKVLIALPGSEAAVRLAMDKLVIPELPHMVREASR